MQRSPTCGYCLQNYEFKDFRPVGPHIPLLLSCGHSFCESCLLKLGRGKESIECPTCKNETKLEPDGERGVKNLLPDIYLLGVLTYNKRAALESGQSRVVTGPLWNFGNIYHLTKKLETGENLKEKPQDDNKESDGASALKQSLCEECNEAAICVCKSCDDCLFCDSCFKQYHSTLKRLQKHQPMPVSYPRKIDLECSEHSGRALEFFDKNLNEPICALCVIAEKCKGHEVVPLGELEDNLQENLQNSLMSAKETLSILQSSEKVIASVVPELSLISNQLLHDVREFFNNMHSVLQIREASILEEAAEILTENFSFTSLMSDCIEKEKHVESIIKECELLCEQPQILRLKIYEMLSRLEACKQMECFAKKVDNQISFEVDKEMVDSVKYIGSLELKGGKRFQLMKLDSLTDEEKDLRMKAKNDIPNENSDAKFNYNAIASTKISSSHELVYVTYVKTPENFFVQRCSDKERLQHMMQNLNKYCRNSDKPEDLVFCPKRGDLVCAQFLADNNWYRAQIICARSQQQPNTVPSWENGLPVEVLYIDYGNTECLPLARLRKMKPQFLEVPELAVQCSLVDIVPPNKEENWSINSIRAFNSLVGEKPLLMNIRFQIGGKLYIDLRRPNDDEPTKDDERPISVRDALVFLEVARFRSPASVAAEPAKISKMYKEPTLPEPEGQTDVIVTHVVSPHEIYVQKFASPINEVHEELAKVCCGRRKEGNNVPFPYRNLVCAAKFSEDKMWYRGLIRNVYADCSVEVQFVDYGNSEKTSLNEIRKLPDTCLDPCKQAFRVQLKDLDFQEGEKEWTPEAIKFLKDSILNKPMVLITKAIENGVPHVELCDTSTDDDIYINHLLAQKGYALSIGQSSEQKPFLVDFGGSGENHRNGTTASDTVLASYPYPNLPSDNVFQVIGTYVSSQGCIFGHKMDRAEEEAKLLRVITQKLNEYESPDLPDLENTDSLRPSQACVAQFSADNLWYRAAVIQIVDEENAEVEFVDFGNTEVVHASNIRLETPFLNIPRQALKFQLYGIEPIGESGTYADDAVNTMNAVMVNQTFAVRLEGIQRSSSLLIASICVSTGEDLAKGLVIAGFAKQTAGAQLEDNPEEQVQRLASLSLNNDFIQPTLPEIGIQFDVHITQVERPNMVFIQRLPHFEDEEAYSNDADDTEEIAKEQYDQLQTLSTLMNYEGYFDDDSSLEVVEAGLPCCAQYSKDDEWYRAKIKSVNRRDGDPVGDVISAEVLFVDYGTCEMVPVERLKTIPEDFLELPLQAICCELVGLYPPEKRMGDFKEFFRDTEWPIDTLKGLYEIVADKRMIASIIDYGPPVKIILLDRVNFDDNETGETLDINVGKILSDKKLAVFDLERYQNSQEEANAPRSDA